MCNNQVLLLTQTKRAWLFPSHLTFNQLCSTSRSHRFHTCPRDASIFSWSLFLKISTALNSSVLAAWIETWQQYKMYVRYKIYQESLPIHSDVGLWFTFSLLLYLYLLPMLNFKLGSLLYSCTALLLCWFMKTLWICLPEIRVHITSFSMLLFVLLLLFEWTTVTVTYALKWNWNEK